MLDTDPDFASSSAPSDPTMITISSHDTVDDVAIMHALVCGDRDALGELYNRHAKILLAVAIRILRNQRDAEDVVHDVFIEAWRNAKSFDSTRGSVRNWLLVRARSRAIDRIRVISKFHGDADESLQQTAIIADEAPLSLDQARAKTALLSLSKEQRLVLELNYFSGLSCRDIAKRYDIPEGTVKSRLLAGMKQLKKLLTSEMGDH